MSAGPDWKARPERPEYDDVRQRLVEAADVIVRERGVSGLRLESVAEGAGLHRSSVYRYFDSKEDLITAVVVLATLRIGRTVIERLGPSASPARFLVDGLALALVELSNDPVHRSLMDPGASEAVARVGGRALTEGLRPLVDPLFQTASERGTLRPGITPDDASRWLQIVASGLVRSPNVVPDTAALRRLLEQMLLPALFEASARQESGSLPS